MKSLLRGIACWPAGLAVPAAAAAAAVGDKAGGGVDDSDIVLWVIVIVVVFFSLVAVFTWQLVKSERARQPGSREAPDSE